MVDFCRREHLVVLFGPRLLSFCYVTQVLSLSFGLVIHFKYVLPLL